MAEQNQPVRTPAPGAYEAEILRQLLTNYGELRLNTRDIETIKSDTGQIKQDLAEFKTQVNQRFDGIDQRADQRFGTVGQRFNTVNQKFDAVDQRFDSVHQEIGELRREVKSVAKTIKWFVGIGTFVVMPIALGITANIMSWFITRSLEEMLVPQQQSSISLEQIRK